jgi:hypothetical protein
VKKKKVRRCSVSKHIGLRLKLSVSWFITMSCRVGVGGGGAGGVM